MTLRRIVALTGLAGLVACNSISGIGDFSFDLDGEAGGGGAGGRGGSGSSTGGAAQGGSGGESECGPCPGVCGTQIVGFSPEDWNLNPGANSAPPSLERQAGENVLVMTTATASQSGTAFYRRPVVTPSFTAIFEVRISDDRGEGGASPFPADGLAFGLQAAGNIATGNTGGAFSLAGIAGGGLAFEIDTYDNGLDANMAPCDAPAPHIGVSTLEPVSAAGTNCQGIVTGIDDAPILAGPTDGQWRQVGVEVVLDSSSYTMRFDSGTDEVLIQGMASPGLSEDEAYFLGFGAATGLYYSRHEIRGLTITFPEPVCL